MRERTSGFSLHLSNEENIRSGMGQLSAAMLLFFGICGCLWSTFTLGETGANLFLLCGVGYIYCAVGCGLPGRHWYLYLAAIIVPAALAIFASGMILDGWNITLNQIFFSLENYIGRIFPRFEVTAEARHALCANLFLMLPTVILAALCGRAVMSGGAGRFVLTLIVAAGWAAAVVFCVSVPLICAVALTLSAVPILGQRCLDKRRTVYDSRMYLCMLALSAVLMAAAAVPPLISGGTGENEAAPFRRAASRVIHSARYGANTGTLPEGDFIRMPAEPYNGAEELLATSETGRSYYLRGFAGEVYLGDGWSELSPARRAEYATLFAWLHDRGFHGQEQFASLTRALGKAFEADTVNIENLSACAEYLYAPYEVSGNKLDKNQIGDEKINPGGFFGEDGYTLTASGSISDHERLYSELTAAHGRREPAVSEYLISENAYRDFVYDNYLEMPDEARAVIEDFLGGLVLPEGKIAFADAQMVVTTYLSTLTYWDLPDSEYDGGDFLATFLERRVGNSLHFATAATLMFRYLGIPARYVEGYRINPDEAEGIADGKGYAWAEIYRDGVGFVPFELNLLRLMPQIQEEYIPENEPPLPEPIPPDTALETMLPILWLSAAAILILLLCFSFLAMRRNIKLKRFRELLRNSGNAEAVGYTATYMIRALAHADIAYESGSLFSLCGELESRFGGDVAEKYKSVIQIQQAAIFSGQQIGDEALLYVSGFLEEILAEIKGRSAAGRRFRLKWIECLF